MQYLFFISVLPVALLLFFVYKKDYRKEPKNLLVSSFLFGALMTIPIIIVEIILGLIIPSNIIGYHIIEYLIGVALVEEGFKWLVVKTRYNKKEFDETYDGIVYGVFVSLGFAAVENLLYVFTKGFGTGVLRALTAVPGHAYYGVIMGYYFGKAKMFKIKKDQSNESKNLALSFIIPTVLHGIYDALLVESIIALLIWFVFVIIVTIYSIKLVFKASKNNERYLKNNYCPNCGNHIEGYNFCDKCGKKNE